MIKTVEQLKKFLGKNYTIAYGSNLAIFAMVDGKRIDLPISEKMLRGALCGSK